MPTKNYCDAVQEGFLFCDNVPSNGTVVEELVAIGYRAGLTDGVEAVKSTAKVISFTDSTPGRFYAIAIDKLASVARKFEDRAKELKV